MDSCAEMCAGRLLTVLRRSASFGKMLEYLSSLATLQRNKEVSMTMQTQAANRILVRLKNRGNNCKISEQIYSYQLFMAFGESHFDFPDARLTKAALMGAWFMRKASRLRTLAVSPEQYFDVENCLFAL